LNFVEGKLNGLKCVTPNTASKEEIIG